MSTAWTNGGARMRFQEARRVDRYSNTRLDYANDYIDHILSEDPIHSFRTKVLTLSDFPPYKRERHIACHMSIVSYLNRFIGTKGGFVRTCLLLPSLYSLTRFFKAPTLEVQKAFRHLSTLGYDYMMPGYYGHISLWTE
jgi:hypothetical protein